MISSQDLVCSKAAWRCGQGGGAVPPPRAGDKWAEDGKLCPSHSARDCCHAAGLRDPLHRPPTHRMGITPDAANLIVRGQSLHALWASLSVNSRTFPFPALSTAPTSLASISINASFLTDVPRGPECSIQAPHWTKNNWRRNSPA